MSQVFFIHSGGVYVCVYMCIYPYASPLSDSIPDSLQEIPLFCTSHCLNSLLFGSGFRFHVYCAGPSTLTQDVSNRTYQINIDISNV